MLATLHGLLNLLATGCSKAIVVDFAFTTRAYLAKLLAVYSHMQNKIFESALVFPCREGN